MGRKLEQIIEDEIKTWTHRETGLSRRGGSPRVWPVITISREFGAGGSDLAALLGEKTGFSIWDKELVQEIAKESGGDEAVLRTLDEHRRRTVDDAVTGALMGAPHTNMQYLRTLMRVVHTIAAHGSAIIVGRGAHYVIRNSPFLRVRVVCPLEQRVKRYAENQHCDLKDARRIVEEKEKDRSEFVRLNFRREVTCTSDYDLVLNSGRYSLEKLADLTLFAYEMQFGRKPPEAVQQAKVA